MCHVNVSALSLSRPRARVHRTPSDPSACASQSVSVTRGTRAQDSLTVRDRACRATLHFFCRQCHQWPPSVCDLSVCEGAIRHPWMGPMLPCSQSESHAHPPSIWICRVILSSQTAIDSLTGGGQLGPPPNHRDSALSAEVRLRGRSGRVGARVHLQAAGGTWRVLLMLRRPLRLCTRAVSMRVRVAAIVAVLVAREV